jgi:hypothetical protein
MSVDLRRVGPQRASYRCLFFGDSITHQAHGTAYATPPITGLMSSIYSSTADWLTWLEILSRGAIRCPIWGDNTAYPTIWQEQSVGARGFWGANWGINGQTSTQILARVRGDNGTSPKASDMEFDVAFVAAGSNDPSNSITTDTSVANILATVDYLLSIGKYVFVFPVRSRGSTGGTTNQQKQYRYINKRLRDALPLRRNTHFIDWERAWTDTTSASGYPFTGYSRDDIHDSAIGGYNLANYIWFGMVGSTQVWQGLQAMFPPRSHLFNSQLDIYDATYNPRGNLLLHGLFDGTGGTANASAGCSGSVASGWTLERTVNSGNTTCVGSLETSADNRGYSQVMTFTPGGTASEQFTLRTGFSSINVSALAGQWVQASCDVEVSATYDKLEQIQLWFKDQATLTQVSGFFNSRSVFLPNTTWKGTIFTPYYYIPNTPPTSMTAWLNTTLTGGGTGSPVVKASRFSLEVVDDPRLQFKWTGLAYPGV